MVKNDDKAPQTDAVRDRLIGLGERSIRKSYYPELQQRLDELRAMHGYLASVLDAIPSAIVGIDQNLIITHANHHASVFTGVALEDLPGKQLLDAFASLSDYLQGAKAAVKESTPLQHRAASVFENGETLFYDITFSPIAGDNGGAVMRVDDVTSQVHMDKVIVQTEKMVSLGGLAAGMAHEINNPLGGILQSAQNISRRLLADLPGNRVASKESGVSMEGLRHYIELRGIDRLLGGIRESGNRAADIISHMLEFSHGSYSTREPFCLADIADSALKLVTSDYDLDKRFGFQRMTIQREYDPNMPAVPVTPSEIEQVLFNLIKNAAQAMGLAKTESPTITVRIRQEKDSAFIEVQDNGPGMNEEQKRRAFEPFYTTKEVGEGTGLGLSVSFFIITTNHQGEFWVDSDPGHGTKFSIRLPLRSAR